MGAFCFNDFSNFPRNFDCFDLLSIFETQCKITLKLFVIDTLLLLLKHNEGEITKLLFDEIDLFKEPCHHMQVIFAIIQKYLKSKVSSK